MNFMCTPKLGGEGRGEGVKIVQVLDDLIIIVSEYMKIHTFELRKNELSECCEKKA